MNACATSTSGLPPCTPVVESAPADSRAMSAEVEGTDAAARKRAFAEALVVGLSSILGVGVRSELKISDSTSTEGDKTVDSSAARQDIDLTLGAAKVKDFRVSYCATPTGGTRAEVRLAARELDRLKRITRDATLVVVLCSAQADGACAADLADRVKAVVQDAHLQVAEVQLASGELSLDEVRSRANAAGAAKAVILRLGAGPTRIEGEYRVCRAQVSASVIDSEDGKTLRIVKPNGFGADGGYKGVVFADRDDDAAACQKAFREALGALHEELERGK